VREENDTAQKPSSALLSWAQSVRLERWIEFLAAIVLSLATVLTAWCGYQAARWGGEQSRAGNEAVAERVMAAQQANLAMLRGGIHVGLFVEYAAAVSQNDQKLADFLYQRFPVELKSATDAWLALDPLHNPDAPPSPFEMEEYRLPEEDKAQEYEEVATQKTQEASTANQRSDDYVLLTVIFAMALFFGGISGRFQWRVIDASMLILGTLVMLYGVRLLLNLPIG
jgi:hypothetical protein